MTSERACELRVAFAVGSVRGLGVNAYWPFGRFRIDTDELHFRVLGWGSPYRIPRSRVSLVRVHTGYPWIGFQIVHTDPYVPPRVIVIPFSNRRFLDALAERGYPLAGPSPASGTETTGK